MMPKIIKMNQKLANMIAAGEVVNRPASVLKELIENAIDAKATKIDIEINDMGMSKMTVTDNGTGMDSKDAHMAFLRHATSKITTENDLVHIQTLGFRGEALAAIASVSKVTLMTRQKDQSGFQVTYHGGNLISEGPASLNEGTSITVSDLFYNTPARFKYIKSEQAEKYALIDIFDRLALSHPKIAFQLMMDDGLVKKTYGQDDAHALIDQIYGKNITKHMIVFKETIQKIDVKGYLIHPEVTRARKKDISVFINGRYIKNYALTQAIIDGYYGYLMINRYPIALIYLHLDPSLVDVNVHPQKFEVKLINESLLAFHLESFIKKALNTHKHPLMYEETEPQKNQAKTIIQPLSFDDFYSDDDKTYTDDRSSNDEPTKKIPEFDYVGIFSGTYILFQNKDGLFMMDQHAAAERIRYEYYHLVLKSPKVVVKDMLIPRSLDLTAIDLSVIKTHQETLKPYGFLFDQNDQLIGIPSWLKDDEIDIAIDTLLMMLSRERNIDLSVLRDHLAKDISCKGSIKANKSLNRDEINQLMKDLRLCENPYTCPHGRPTIIKLSHYEIEKLFKRVVV